MKLLLCFNVFTIKCASQTEKKTVICGIVPDTVYKVRLRINDATKCLYENPLVDLQTMECKTENSLFINGYYPSNRGKLKYFRFELNITCPIWFDLSYGQSPGYFHIGYGALPVYSGCDSRKMVSRGLSAEPGDSLFIEADDRLANSDISRINISGKGSDKIRCVQAIIHHSKLFVEPGWHDKFPEKISLAEMLRACDSVTNMILTTIDLYKHKLSPISAKLLKAYYIPVMVPDISQVIREMIDKGKADINSKEIFNLYKSRISLAKRIINPSDTQLRYVAMYFDEFILTERAYLEYAFANKIKTSGLVKDNLSKAYAALEAYLPEGPLKERVLAFFLCRVIKKNGYTPEIDTIVKSYLKRVVPFSNPDYVKRVSNLFESTQLNLAKGRPAYDFALPDTSGRIVRMSDFKGKVVVIDFMFNGCGACKALIPILSKAESLFHGRDVAFISISVDKTIEGERGWKAGIGVFSSPSSIQLYTEGKGMSHSIIQHYKISSAPTLIVIDRVGKIVVSRIPNPGKENVLIDIIKNTLNESN